MTEIDKSYRKAAVGDATVICDPAAVLQHDEVPSMLFANPLLLVFIW